MTAPNIAPGAVTVADERHNVQVGSQGFDPKNAAELMSMAKFIHQSELKPQGLKSAADCFLVMAIGMSYGFDPIMALQTLHVVKGRVGLPGETCAALIQSHPLCKEFRTWFEGEGAQRAACVQSWRKGRAQPNEVVRFSMADAKRAGLSGDNWSKYPDDMALWKAVARDKRRNWPDVYPRMQVVEDMDEPTPRERAHVAGPDPLLVQMGSAVSLESGGGSQELEAIEASALATGSEAETDPPPDNGELFGDEDAVIGRDEVAKFKTKLNEKAKALGLTPEGIQHKLLSDFGVDGGSSKHITRRQFPDVMLALHHIKKADVL